MKVVGNVHDRLNHPVNYFHDFISTGTCMPISHMIPEEDWTYPSIENYDMDRNVKLQHYEQYDY